MKKQSFNENNDYDQNKENLFNDSSDLPKKPFEPVDYNINYEYNFNYDDNNKNPNENNNEKLRTKNVYSKQKTDDLKEKTDENKKQIDEKENYDNDLNKKEIKDEEKQKNIENYYRNLNYWHYYWHWHNYYHQLYHQHYYYHNYYNNLQQQQKEKEKEENHLNPSNKLIDNNDDFNNNNTGIINKPVVIENKKIEEKKIEKIDDNNKKIDNKNLLIERENSTVPVEVKKHDNHINKIVDNDNNINVKGIINNPIIEESKEEIIFNKTELPQEIDKEKQCKGWMFLKILSFVSYEKNNRFAKGFFDTWREKSEIKKKNFEDNQIETKFDH